jgi:hypothetical protein
MEFNPNNLMNSIWSLVPTGFPDFDWDIPDFWNAFLCCHMRLLAQLYPKSKQGGETERGREAPPGHPVTHVAKRCWVQAGGGERQEKQRGSASASARLTESSRSDSL